MWNFDISAAPKGRVVEKQSTANGKTVTRTVHQEEWVILASKCGAVSKSHWIEKEARWNFYEKDEQPIAWQPWPAHPHAEESGVA